MNDRKEYEMTQEDLDKILNACKPVPYLVVGGVAPRSPQENANDAWAELGKRMGFDYLTVEPTGKGLRSFSAVPLPTEDALPVVPMHVTCGGPDGALVSGWVEGKEL